MKRHHYLIILCLIIVLAGALTIASARPLMGSGAPEVVSYTGMVTEGGTPYDGTGHLKFALVNAAGDISYWSNDGTSTGGGEPTAGVQLELSEGHFNVLLGDTTLANMTSLDASVFSGTERYLRVWFSPDEITFTLLSPAQRIASVPYALQAQEAVDADTVDGFHANQLGAHYQNLVIVAKSGGDYTSIQAAIDSIGGEAVDNPYLVWIAPGVYNEAIILKSYVHLQGSGQGVTIITSSVLNGSEPPIQATMVMASDTSLRDLSIENSGTGMVNAALINSGIGVLLDNIMVRTYGGGTTNYAIYLQDGGTSLQHVTAISTNGSNSNYGLYNKHWSGATLSGGLFEAYGGMNTYGIYSTGTATYLEASHITARGIYGSTNNYGLYNTDESESTLFGGSFNGNGGVEAYGIMNDGFTFNAEGIHTLGENASSVNAGFQNSNVMANLRGGSFIGTGGDSAYGIINDGGYLVTIGVFSFAELGSSANYGLSSHTGATAELHGGKILASGGVEAYGINSSMSAHLRTRNVTVLAENATTANYGLYNDDSTASYLIGGSFAAISGGDTYALYNIGSSGHISALNLYIQGEFGSGTNYAIYNDGGAITSVTYCVMDGLTN